MGRVKPDNLLALKDDMVAFIEGHGMRHFPAVIPEDMARIWWNDTSAASSGNSNEALLYSTPEGWKDFVEMAKSVGAPMVCIGEDTLDKPTLEVLAAEIEEISDADDSESERTGEEMEKIHRLFLEIGKLGHIELAFAHQGVLFVHETNTEWYRTYREMVETIDQLHELVKNALGKIDREQE
jgi:hypothetical protein